MMTKVKIVSADGTKQVDGYIDHGKTAAEQKEQKIKERLHTVYLVLAIAFFSMTIYSVLKRKPQK